jgi:hypothetical protein
MAPETKKQNKAAFLPWSAINAFMLEDFQLEVLTDVLTGYDHLESEQRRSLNAKIKKGVKVPGFRTSTAAPVTIRIRHSIEYFENNAGFAGNVLAAWAHIYHDLADKVYSFLCERKWTVLPLEASREKLPGFLTQWPQEDEFEVLTAAFHEKYPEDEYSDNQISLMCVWVSTRLPYELAEKAILMKETEDDSESVD